MHVYDFITDTEQYSIKRGSRVFDKDQPFENVLTAYQQLFMQHFESLTIEEESKYLNDPLKTDAGLKEWLGNFLQLIKNDKQNIIKLFADLENIYEVFIGGKHQTAVSLLYHLLEKYDLLDNVYYEMLGCFFRGRIIQKGDNYLEEAYYYHIPFNKRFLIKNQRFSFSGIPLLYAGESLISTFYELGAKDLEDKGIAVATFNYDHLAYIHLDKDWQRIRSRNKIFDITNSIYDLINDLFYDAIEKGKKIEPSGEINFPKQTLRRAFRKFILSQVCTFPRKHHTDNQHFVEEYVLPQLLTEAVRQHKYDGIIYPSTRFIGKKIDFGKGWHNMIFKANLAMFTDYAPGKNYDDTLLKTIVPHVINLSKINTVNAHELLANLKEAVLSVERFLLENTCLSEVRGRFIIQLAHFEKKVRTYELLTVDSKPYLDSYAGKVEAAYMKEYFHYVSKLIKQVYPEEFEKYMEKWRKSRNINNK